MERKKVKIFCISKNGAKRKNIIKVDWNNRGRRKENIMKKISNEENVNEVFANNKKNNTEINNVK